MYSKREVVEKYFYENPPKLTLDKNRLPQIIEILSSKNPCLRQLGVNKNTVTAITKRLSPNYVKFENLDIAIFKFYNLKYCYKCSLVKPFEDFRNNFTRKDNKQSECKVCMQQYQKDNMHIWILDNLNRRLALEHRTVKFGQEGIKEFYANCPEGYEVDHIIPLRGVTVSGLHVISNLQYLLKEDNRVKSNKFDSGALV